MRSRFASGGQATADGCRLLPHLPRAAFSLLFSPSPLHEGSLFHDRHTNSRRASTSPSCIVYWYGIHRMPTAASFSMRRLLLIIGLVEEQNQGLDSPSYPPCWCRSKCTNGTNKDTHQLTHSNSNATLPPHGPVQVSTRLRRGITGRDDAPLRRRRLI